MKTLSELLIELKSFDSDIDFVHDKTIEEAVAECQNGEWLLRLAEKINIDQLPGRETETYFTTDEAVAYVKNKLLKDINKLLPYHVLNGSVIYVKSELDEWLNDINNDETRCKPTL